MPFACSRILPGTAALQGSDDHGLPTERRQGSGRAAAEAAAAAVSGRRRKVMVMFIGGVTCAEVGGQRSVHSVRCRGALERA